MATTITAYNHLSELLAGGDLEGATVMLALVTSAYTFDATHTAWASASGSEVATGAGYTTGGAAVASWGFTRTAGVTTFTGSNVTWSALTKTFRRAVAYISGSVGGVTNPVLFSVLYNDAPADVEIAGIDFITAWNASGIVRVGAGTVS